MKAPNRREELDERLRKLWSIVDSFRVNARDCTSLASQVEGRTIASELRGKFFVPKPRFLHYQAVKLNSSTLSVESCAEGCRMLLRALRRLPRASASSVSPSSPAGPSVPSGPRLASARSRTWSVRATPCSFRAGLVPFRILPVRQIRQKGSGLRHHEAQEGPHPCEASARTSVDLSWPAAYILIRLASCNTSQVIQTKPSDECRTKKRIERADLR